jgi:hypothetical protein
MSSVSRLLCRNLRWLALVRRDLGFEQDGRILQDVRALAAEGHALERAIQFQEHRQDVAVRVKVEAVKAYFLDALRLLDLTGRSQNVGKGQLAVRLAVVSLEAEGTKCRAAVRDLHMSRVRLRRVQRGVGRRQEAHLRLAGHFGGFA